VKNNSIRERIKLLQNTIDSVLIKTNRTNSDIQVMVVTKNAAIPQIIETKKAGLNLFGENYIKNAYEKIPSLINTNNFSYDQFHMIGHLQSNKVKQAVKLFSSIDSVDSLHLANEIAKNVDDQEKPYSIMLEVKTAKDESKFGFSEEIIMDEFGQLLLLKQLRVNGLMTIGTYEGTKKETTRCFVLLRTIKEKLEKAYQYPIPILSMGMSEDYSIAIEEGSNMLRIGRAIFGG
jgi:PLP dependent protein